VHPSRTSRIRHTVGLPLTRVLSIVALVLAANAVGASAQTVEISPFVGYRFGGDFFERVTGQAVDRVYVPSVERGVNNACTEGILAGYRVVDVQVDFYDGKMHPVDSKDIAFQIATRSAQTVSP